MFKKASKPPKTSPKQTKVQKEEEMKLANWTHLMFKNALIAKSDKTKKWKEYMSAYDGTYFSNSDLPDYKSNQISNFIFSTIETIRPIMMDGNPRFEALPRTPKGVEHAEDVQIALNYEWDREKMGIKVPASLVTTLVLGTSIFYTPWDANDGKHGNVKGIPINPFNMFPDPLATSTEDAEYLIYAAYKHVNQLKKIFPETADLLQGGGINYSELVNGNDDGGTRIDNQVLTLETWCRDYTTVDVEEVDEDGSVILKKKMKYPRGRVIVSAPELNIIFSDKPNPYKDGRFPFVLNKDYDIPFEFWGRGEVEQLLSPQKYINELSNQVIDNAKSTANMQWIIDRNSGIGNGKLTNRPGLIIRKNPGSEVRRDAPPSMPTYVTNKIQDLKNDIENISGIFESTRGQRDGSVVAAQAILALQEAGQARIRLKVKLLESSLGELATMWYNRIQQYWKTDRWVRVSNEKDETEFKEITKEIISEDYDIKISSGSTMPINKSAMLELMIRLAQTMAEDGLPMVDRQTILQYVPTSNKNDLMRRMEERANNITAQQYNEELTVFKQDVEGKFTEISSILQELSQAVQQLNKAVDSIDGEHQKWAEEEKLNKATMKGYEEGYSEAAGLIDEESVMEDEEGLEGVPDELIESLSQLTDEELALVLEQYPNLQEIINQ